MSDKIVSLVKNIASMEGNNVFGYWFCNDPKGVAQKSVTNMLEYINKTLADIVSFDAIKNILILKINGINVEYSWHVD